LGFLAGPDPRDPASSTLPVPDYVAHLGDPVRGLRIGIDETVVAEAHPDVQRMVDQVAGILTKLRLTRASCRFPDWQTLDHLVQLVQLPDASAAHSVYMRTRPGDYGPQVRARAEVGHFISAVDHMTALRARGMFVERTLKETFKDIDIAILPILADPLPTIAELDVSGGPQVQAAMGRVVKFTRPINYLGLPTLTLPIPRGGGLPTASSSSAGRSRRQLSPSAAQREVPPEIARPLKG
jgi:aspartyl-tRNA(Asn)/glutamyl-tRNA(Gln) amidotransferase subunit A